MLRSRLLNTLRTDGRKIRNALKRSQSSLFGSIHHAQFRPMSSILLSRSSLISPISTVDQCSFQKNTDSKRLFVIDTRQMSRKDDNFTGIPSAYKKRNNRHRDKKGIGKGVDDEGRRNKRRNSRRGKRKGKSSILESSNRTSATSSDIFPLENDNIDPITEDSIDHSTNHHPKYNSKNVESIKYINERVQRWLELEGEVQCLLKELENDLGMKVDADDKSIMNMNPVVVTKNLIKTENLYKNICAKLRFIIAGWGWFKNADTWTKHQKELSLPPANALKLITLLENIRRQRHGLINFCLESNSSEMKARNNEHEHRANSTENGSQGFLSWISEALVRKSNTDFEAVDDDKNWSSSLHELNAHLSQDFTANTLLYDGIFTNCQNWRLSNVEAMTTVIEDTFKLLKESHNAGNPNVIPSTLVYHRMIEFYNRSSNLNEVKKNVQLIKEMIGQMNEFKETKEEITDVRSSTDKTICVPTTKTYGLAISGFRGIGSNTDVKVQALDSADEILKIMEQEVKSGWKPNTNQSSSHPKEVKEKKNDSFDLPLCYPYRAMLLNLIAVGPNVIDEYIDRVDDTMTRLLGKDEYEKLFGNDKSLINLSKVDCIILDDLHKAFTATFDMDRFRKAKNLLGKMEATREASLSDNLIQWSPMYPSKNCYYNAIFCLLAIAVDSKNVVTTSDARYATGVLDKLLQDIPSAKNEFCCYRLIRIWGETKSRKSGTIAEEILSRMEMSRIINGNNSVSSSLMARAKQSTLENYAKAASLGEPKAAHNCYKFLKRIQERLPQEMSSENENREKLFFYIAVIKACAGTVVEEDKPEALEIAIDIYNNRLLAEDVILTPYVFVQMLLCCELIAPTSHDIALRLSKDIFQAACENGLVQNHVLRTLKRVNYNLFESYKKIPEHSANVKEFFEKA